MRYHLGLDGGNATRGKRLRPLLGLLAYQSLAGSHQRALPGAAAVELGHNSASSTTTSRMATTSDAIGRPVDDQGGAQAINTGDTLFTLSRLALHRLSDLGFSARRCWT